MRHRHPPLQSGFTLLELVAVILLMSFLGATALVHWTPAGGALNAQAAQLARTLRHAQAMALSQGRRLSMVVPSTTTYAIRAAGLVIRDPQGIEQSFNLGQGVSLVGRRLDFDSLGRPVDSTGNLITSAGSWVLSAAGSGSATVSVSPLSGFVTVAP